ncbi:MAG TPA: metal ABC transporter substrate-binding protein, partial [Methylomirabilota bacterium]|nr:metal ABC transporter substrate-binding protein [Methylomirabilota bacterium]
EIGGERVQATSFFQGHQEPELWVDEVFPSWLVRASRAKALARIGLFADVWMDTVIEGAHNPAVAPGGPGHIDASHGIAVIEAPAGRVDRTMGEIHVQGNPHYLLDPANMAIVADHVRRALGRVSPGDADLFARRARDLAARLDAALGRWEQAAQPLRGRKLAAYHRTWSYFARRYGLEVVGYCEPKPGIEPSPADLRRLTETMARTGARLIVHEPVYSPRVPQTVAAEVGRATGTPGRVMLLPAHVGGVPEAKDYFAFIDTLIARLGQGLA